MPLALTTELGDAHRRRQWDAFGSRIREVATVTVLLVVCWLFVASLVRVVSVDLGIDRSRLIGVTPRLPFKAPVDDVDPIVSLRS